VDLFHIFNSAAGVSRIEESERARTAMLCRHSDLPIPQTIDQFQKWVQSSSNIGSPRNDALLVLVKLNVFRALVSNSRTLGVLPGDAMDDDAISQFCSTEVSADRILALPSALRPTGLQNEVAHHPWIDFLPVPRMRHNLIQRGDTFDDMKLCGDLVGLFSAGTGSAGLIVWGESWDVAGWEVTEEFLKNWGWTIKECWELFESTNWWRAQRGERLLSFEGL
jgi:hypothetical protein